jgi:hypothetical protein
MRLAFSFQKDSKSAKTDMQKIQRISSNLTLFLKIFIPTFWFVFYGAIVIASFLSPAIATNAGLKYGILVFYLSGSVVIYFTLLNLKRVEYDDHFLYVTNYFKTVRIPWHNVKGFKEKKILFIPLGSFTFNTSITFGKRIHFLESPSLIKLFKEEHQEMLG